MKANKVLPILCLLSSFFLLPGEALSHKEDHKNPKARTQKVILLDDLKQRSRAKPNTSINWSNKQNQKERQGFLNMSQQEKEQLRQIKDPFN